MKIDDYSIDTELNPTFEAKNLIGYIDGKNTDSLIVITAHYDHLGKVGKMSILLIYLRFVHWFACGARVHK